MRRDILQWPDPRLRRVADPVDKITDEIRDIWTDMIETMEAMPGYGLAAPQIGVMLRLAVVDCSDERGKAVRMANPEVIAQSPEIKPMPEASPCLPGVDAKVPRPTWVDVSFLDKHGFRVRQKFEDMWAVSVLHQIDHLNGRLFVDNLSRTKRDMLIKKSLKGST